MADGFTLLDGDRTLRLEASVAGDRVQLDPEALRRELGWKLEPEGLCREGICIPVRDRAALVGERGVDLAAFAGLLDRPLALDVDERSAVLGTGHAARAARLASLEAPDFALPDLSGRVHRLSELRGRKVLLVAYASW